jgi:hypothetical protein
MALRQLEITGRGVEVIVELRSEVRSGSQNDLLDDSVMAKRNGLRTSGAR